MAEHPTSTSNIQRRSWTSGRVLYLLGPAPRQFWRDLRQSNLETAVQRLQEIKTNKTAGFKLVEIMIVVAIIGLLAAIAIPNFVKARENAQLNSIFNNLRIIEGAKDQWALENKKGTGDAVASIVTISDFLKGGTVKPVVGETYDTTTIGASSTAKLPATVK